VLDFGLVKAIGDTGGESALRTAVGDTPGTPAYLAPELALGKTVDGRTDLYAAGCVLHYLLTGRLVFEGQTAVEMVARHLHHEPEPPSAQSPGDLPRGLDEVVLACLAKDPEKRPRSAAELMRALAAIEIDPWTEEQAAAWWRARGRG
jgi:serine/threonine-protein kinase